MIQGWEKTLAEYIDSRRDMPFKWGPNDCISFSNGAMNAICGFGFGDHWVGRYKTNMGALRVFEKEKKRGGFSGIIDAIDAKLKRASYPSRGALVAREMKDEFFGYRIGVCLGELVAFISAKGLIFEPVLTDDIAWSMP